MTDQFAKTLVIDDPDYNPADILPLAATKAHSEATQPQSEQTGEDVATATFEENSWLT